jgi:lactoylglutathione lyase
VDPTPKSGSDGERSAVDTGTNEHPSEGKRNEHRSKSRRNDHRSDGTRNDPRAEVMGNEASAPRTGESERQAGSKARAIGINHVAIEVGDIAEALAFYGRFFDFELRGRARGMAFIDLGDQFIALARGDNRTPAGPRHFGLVVDDKEKVRESLLRAGTRLLRSPGLDFLDPWGNHIQVVQYSDIQFTKAPHILEGLGLGDLTKSPSAMRELRQKGLAPP